MSNHAADIHFSGGFKSLLPRHTRNPVTVTVTGFFVCPKMEFDQKFDHNRALTLFFIAFFERIYVRIYRSYGLTLCVLVGVSIGV